MLNDGEIASPSTEPQPQKPQMSVEQRNRKARRLMLAALPHRWIAEATGEALWDKQIAVARAVAANRRVAVASANSCGKSFLVSRLVAWWLSIYSDSVVITTAPTTRQVENILWREIRAAYHKALRNGVKLSKEAPLVSRWEINGDKHFAMGFAPKDYDSTTFQGLHSPHMLVIIDEAAGVSEEVYNGALNVLRGSEVPRLVAIGNPTTTTGWFHDAFLYADRGWHTIHISGYDSPNVKAGKIVLPGIITAEDIEQAKIDYASAPMLFKSLILGQFPDKSEDALIALEWVEAARYRDEHQFKHDVVQVGADIARFGSDLTVFTARRGGYGFAIEDHAKRNTMEVCGLLKLFCQRVGARIVAIDSVGLGAGVVDRCREIMPSLHVMEMQASNRAEEASAYSNAGTEWWATLAGDLQMGRVGGPIFKDARLTADLVGRRYKVRSDGVIALESKNDSKRRNGRRSPDFGDSVALAYAPVFISRKRSFVWGREAAA